MYVHHMAVHHRDTPGCSTNSSNRSLQTEEGIQQQDDGQISCRWTWLVIWVTWRHQFADTLNLNRSPCRFLVKGAEQGRRNGLLLSERTYCHL